jgi:hypothetical protein
MSEFDDLQGDLAQAREATRAARREAARLRRQLARLKRERRRGERGRTPGTGTAPQDRLAGQIAALEREIDRHRATLATTVEAEAGIFTRFSDFTDPRRNLQRLSDRTPILLMPLRIETRFKVIGTATDPATGAAARDGNELWVRVYPDDVSIDTFEETLSESEVRKARTYWAEIWRAAGNEGGERGAWRVFLSGQGAGRAWWVVQNYRPLNEGDRPEKADGVPTVILSIVTDAPLAEPERSQVSAFWEALWRAGDDGAAQGAAFAALVAELGADRARAIQEQYQPRNLADPPPAGSTRPDTTVVVAYLEFPTDEALDVREAGWSQVPHVATLPDRLVLLGYNAGQLELERLGEPIPSRLTVAPDPSADEDQQIRRDGADIKVDDEMAWLTDFERAIKVGMAFRVPLSATAFRRGFDKLMVLGVRMRSSAGQSKAALEELIQHQQASKAGFSFLPQGRPTNNVEGEAAAYSWQEDPDVSFDHYFGVAPPDPSAGYAKTDGRRFAEALGLSADAVRTIPFYGRTDVGDALAMNSALWPATLGYFMDTMLQPVFDDSTVQRTREFFTHHVLARGPLPAIRVGKQPYGILPATVRSRMEWLSDRTTDPATGTVFLAGDNRHLQGLYALLRKVEADLAPLLAKVSYVGKSGDQHQVLLDVIGLHAGSVEFEQRYAESFTQLYNRFRMQGAGGAFLAILISLGYVRSGLDLLQRLGYQAEPEAPIPDILERLFLAEPNRLKGDLIDDRPLSETDPVRAYTEAGENYIEWLIKAAKTSHDALRLKQGFSDSPPTALLYLMLHHALDLSFVETSIRLFMNAGLIDQAQFRAAKREPNFIQVREASLADPVAAGGSRWQYLYRNDPAVSGTAQRTVGQFIPTVLTTMTATAYLKRQLDALEHLKRRPTAVLERAFVEHLDLCSYRFDAWYGGLLSYQLAQLRAGPAGQGPANVPGGPAGDAGTTAGLYLGAYGWLENVRPEFKRLDPVQLPEELAEIFLSEDEPPLVSDATNQGYIHAPSVNHAVTAAVLRNGYLSNATAANPGSFAVNLTSERVRIALSIVQGMQGEQSLGALLGYQFERGLHDRHDVEVDEFIYDLRKAFPLVGDRLLPTRTGGSDELGRRLRIQRVEARNVIDGLALVEHVRKSGDKTYPFGLGATLPPASPAQAKAIGDEAQRIADIADAVADLAMAESVHQVVQGNYERAGAVLDAYSKGKFAAGPDVIRTPRSGVTLTHRVALHLKAGLDPADPGLTSPRARAEPALNDWLGSILPAAASVACQVKVTDPLDATTVTHTVTQADLGLLPIDLLYLLDPDDERSGRTMDDLIEAHVIATFAPRPHAELAITYRDRIAAIPGHVPFFELAPLVRSLRSLLLRTRPLRATDMTMSQEATGATDGDVALAPQRITLVRDALQAHLADLTAFHGALQARLDAEEAALIATEIDGTIDTFAGLMISLAPYAGLDTGTSAVHDDRRRIFAAMLAQLHEVTERWDARLAEFDLAIAAYDAAPGQADEQKFLALLMAERVISTERTDPVPATPDPLRNDLVDVKRVAFVAQRDALAALRASATTLGGLHDAIVAARPVNATLDPVELDAEQHTGKIVVLAEDMAKRAAALVTDLTARLAGVQAQLVAEAAESAADKKVAALTAAAKFMLGQDFQIVPDFSVPQPQATEWSNAWGPGPAADDSLLDHLRTGLGRRFPVDDWFVGVARVREKMRDLETAGHLMGAFTGAEAALQPLQFPHRTDVPWLALDFPETDSAGEPFRIDEDKLLYTAHYAQGFNAALRQAGLLLDEWTEVVPGRTEDTGLAFHFDRPNSEPPQALLLALPPKYTGGWRWQDLVDTVHETFDLARKRAIEPDHIDGTAYARFLPALVSAVTLHPITASLNLAFNNNLAAVLAADGGGNE